MSEKEFITAKDVVFAYEPEEGCEPHNVLDGVSLSIRRGEFVALLGHNGSGKSTMAKMFNAMLLPTGGKVFVDGMDTVDEEILYEIRRRVGLVLQNPDNQLVASVVEEDVAFGPENLGIPPEEIRQRVDEALKAVGMYDFRLNAPYKLSGGQKQRIAIAGIIAMQPDCIVLDEPTAGLDPQGRDVLLAQITSYHKTRGNTVLLVSHSMEDIARTADRILVMNSSHAAMFGPTKEIFARGAELEQMGLRVPQITKILAMLRERGWPIGTALTMEEAVRELLPLLEKGGVRV